MVGHGMDLRHAPGRIRTCDLALRRRALYPLSYGRGDGTSVAAGAGGDRAPLVQNRYLPARKNSQASWARATCPGVNSV